MTILGIDISHHQGSFDVERAAREGIDFFIFKATEGSGFTDSRFAENVAKARKTGKPFAAYHYQRSGVSAAAQVAHISRVVPRDIPVIPDVEAGSGNVSLTRDIVARLRAAGYSVPLLYLPRWYWQQIGSPSLAGLPPLWSSRYPDNVVGDIRDEYADVPPHFWDGYGGLRVAVLQFTSSARVAGRAPIDGNAYRGSFAELRALLTGAADNTGGGSAAPAAPKRRKSKEDRMSQLAVGYHIEYFSLDKGDTELVIGCPTGEMDVTILWHGPGYPKEKDPKTGIPKYDWVASDYKNTIHRMRPAYVKVPDKATGFDLIWDFKPEKRPYQTQTAKIEIR